MMTIGQAAKLTGVKVPTIRFYEAEGLLPARPRTDSGRRLYDEAAVQRLNFIRHARQLGFELEQTRALLQLADHGERPCADVDTVAAQHLETVRARIDALVALERELSRIVAACCGGPIAECRIIEALNAHEHCDAGHAADRR